MVYVSSDGHVLQNRPWNVQRIIELFWTIIAAILFFFKSLVGLDNKPTGSSGGRRSGGSGGGNGPDGGGPKRRNVKSLGDFQSMDCNLPGGG